MSVGTRAAVCVTTSVWTQWAAFSVAVAVVTYSHQTSGPASPCTTVSFCITIRRMHVWDRKWHLQPSADVIITAQEWHHDKELRVFDPAPEEPDPSLNQQPQNVPEIKWMMSCDKEATSEDTGPWPQKSRLAIRVINLPTKSSNTYTSCTTCILTRFTFCLAN